MSFLRGVSKSCFIVEPCFHHYALFGCVLIYIFGFNLTHALAIKRIEGLQFCYIHFSNVQYRRWVLKGRNACFCICYCSLVILHNFVVISLCLSVSLYIHIYIYTCIYTIYTYIYIYNSLICIFICKCQQI